MWCFRRTSKLCLVSPLLRTPLSLPNFKISKSTQLPQLPLHQFKSKNPFQSHTLFISTIPAHRRSDLDADNPKKIESCADSDAEIGDPDHQAIALSSKDDNLMQNIDPHNAKHFKPCADSDSDSDSDPDPDDEIGAPDCQAIELSAKDETLMQNIERILGILHDFRSDAVGARARLEYCGSLASPELVQAVLSRVRNDWEAAFTFFLWAQKQPDYVHSVADYHLMISVLAKMRRFDTAWALVDEMRRGGPGVPKVIPQTLMIMIRRYCAAHDVAKAVGTFYAFKRYGFTVGVEEFQDLLSALCRYKNVRDAEHLLFCNEKVFPMETKSYNIILNGWCNMMVNLRQAKRFWWNMGRRGIARDAFSYGSMISCYSKAGNLRDVMKLYNEMKDLGIDPDRRVYNAVVYALAKGNCVKEAFDTVKVMEEKGCGPNSVTYNSLIKPLCKARHVDEAQRLFDEMLQRGFSPSDRTYHAFFAILRTADEVFELLEKMKVNGSGPSSDTYIMLIRKFCRWRQHENVFKLWNEMNASGVGPDQSSYIVLIHGLFLNGRLDDAYKYYLEMKDQGFPPEPKTDEMIEAWVSGKEIAEHQVLQLKGKNEYLGFFGKGAKATSNVTGIKRDFLKQPETISVTRERGFSLR